MTPDANFETHRRYWLARADRLRFPVNTLWWLRTALPGAVAAHAALAAGILVCRRAGAPVEYVFSGYAAAMAVTGVVAWFRSRKKFIGASDALLRLENHLRLHNRLSAASAGAAPWPEPVVSPKSAYTFDAKSWLIPAALMFGLPAVAAVAPLPHPAKPAPAVAVAEPPEWKEVEQWAEKLKEENAADAESLKRMEERVAALREENKDGMFRQGAQEATQALKSEAKLDIASLAQNAAKAGELLSNLEALAARNRESAPAELSKEWKDALDKLGKSGLPADALTMAELGNIDPSKLKALDPRKFKVVKAKLRKTSKEAGECSMDPDAVALLLAQCDGRGAGSPSLPGGPGGGGGPSDLRFSNDAKNLPPEITALPGIKDGDSVEAGDMLAVRERKPDPDAPKTFARQNGGAGDFTGLGGDVVRRDRLTPEEAEFLSKYDAPAKK